MNLADYKNIWVFIETECGKPKNVGFELINAAKPLAQEKGCELIAVVIGKDIEGVAKDAICYGADSAIIVDGPEYEYYTTDAFAKALVALVEKYKPDGADSILDIVNDSAKWKADISKAYQYLYAALVKYNNAVDAENRLETYAQGRTNLSYLFVDKKSGKVYSNIKSVTADNYEKILDKKIRNLPDPYMIIYPEEQDCETGFTGTTDQAVNYWQTMIANVGLADSDYVYARY